MNNQIKKCIEIVGCGAKIAKELNVSDATVSFWLNNIREPSTHNAMKLHRLVKKYASRKDLNPSEVPTLENIKPSVEWGCLAEND